MRILVFMPRNMRFGPSNAAPLFIFASVTSSPQVATARRQQSSAVENETLFPEVEPSQHQPTGSTPPASQVLRVFVPPAAPSWLLISISWSSQGASDGRWRPNAAPVIFHKHNMTTAVPRGGVSNNLRRRWRLRQYLPLASSSSVTLARTPSKKIGLKFRHHVPSSTTAWTFLTVSLAATLERISSARAARLPKRELKKLPWQWPPFLALIRAGAAA